MVAPRSRGGALKVLMLDPPAAVCAVTHNLCNALADAGCEVHLATAPQWTRMAGRATGHRYQARIVFYRRSQLREYRASTRFARLFWRAARLLGHLWTMAKLLAVARRFDVVHVQWFPVPALDAVWLWLVARRVPVSYTVHNQLPHDCRARWARHALYRAIYRIPRVLFVHTTHTARGLIRDFGVPPQCIVQIPHGSMRHLLEIPPTRLAAPPAAGAPVVLFVGQIRHHKGLDVLLRAAALLRRRGVAFRLLVVGRPLVDMRPYQRLARDLDLASVVDWRLGYIEEEALPALFELATIVALPYRSVDQSGIAVAACTFGKALVATRCGGLEELVREAGNGLLVPVDDPAGLADAIADLLRDDDTRRRFEVNSRQYADEALAWEPIAERTLAAYRTVLPAPSPTPQGKRGSEREAGHVVPVP